MISSLTHSLTNLGFLRTSPPSLGISSPVISLMIVLLPLPFGPTMHTDTENMVADYDMNTLMVVVHTTNIRRNVHTYLPTSRVHI